MLLNLSRNFLKLNCVRTMSWQPIACLATHTQTRQHMFSHYNDTSGINVLTWNLNAGNAGTKVLPRPTKSVCVRVYTHVAKET